ncbi:phage tail sheath subtilisin-like domain-containing protein [Chelatococcus composti]|uniref:Phage tail sheath gpL-like n=1 Tax=Chelatococcus composti TaxID=1743235 RepID=A0A841KET4_9HYPH|nr:phage tail sheath subtilisin-like domain-containing protein [Chelatococcus composti]MBB6169484.1 phage tail sheath gpL-like [Chelatococcus composti]MBS7737047.1 phage tail sheath subtilisin-like domain-containing protein [Chelatococcus composti]GGG48108.1 tail sheath protein [Chelatococcus composti]
MSIGFNFIPGSGLVAPLFAFEVNSAGWYDSVSRLVLFGHKTSGGSLADNTPSVVTSLSEADALAGPGSMLREMYRIAAANAPAQEIWIVPVPETGTAPTWTLTVGSPPATGGVGIIDICGERLSVTIAPGDAAADVAAALAAAINGYYNDLTGAMLPVTASAASEVVTVTSRHKGAIMAEVDIFVPTTVSGNFFATSGALTVATGTAAAGTPSLAAALAALGDEPADMIVSPWSDATSLDAYGTALSDVSGRWSWMRQSYGHVMCSNTGNTASQSTLGLGRNDRHVTIIPRLAGSPQPSWLWAAGFAARVLPWLADIVTGNVSRNQTGLVVEGLAPPRDRSTWWGYSARNTLTKSGISTWKVTADGKVAIDKLVTTYRLGPSGQPDSTFRDIQALFQVSGGLSYIRTVLANEQGQKALADDNPGNLAAITTPKDIKGSFVHAYEALVQRGVFENAPEFVRRLDVRRNAENPNRVDVFAPLDRVNPLDILAANATIYQQYVRT